MKTCHFRIKFAGIVLSVSLLCVLFGVTAAQEFKTVHPGVEYALVHHKLGSEPVKINLLRLDLRKVRLDVHHALDKAIGVEPTSAIATRHGAVAAINAGFFRLDKSEFAGDSVGILMTNGELLSESSNSRSNLVMEEGTKETTVSFGHFTTFVSFGFEGGRNVIPISGINRERKSGEVVLYDSRFGKTTGTRTADAEVILSNCDRVRSRSGVRAVVCRTLDLKRDIPNSAIPDRGFVISIDKSSDQLALIGNEFDLHLRQRPKHRPFVRFTFRDEQVGTVLVPGNKTDIVTGVPQLIKNGKIDITWEQEKAGRSFVEMRHPRTAVAKLKDGKFLMITVDGRQPGVSVGMNLYELADYLLSLGATDAMNLDGGGSTTMFLDGRVVNTPSDREGERKVGDAILVTLRKNARR